MKKNTLVKKVVPLLAFISIVAPTIVTQAATLASLFDTFEGYLSVVNSILEIGKPSDTDLTNSRDAVSDKSTYGVSEEIDLTGTAFDPIDLNNGQINFDETADDAIDVRLATNQGSAATRTIEEFQSLSELTTMQAATRMISKASKEADKKNQEEVVPAANQATETAYRVMSSQPIGTCNSSLCAENAHNILIAEQIKLQSVAISLSLMNNAYSKINNDGQAILVKNEQDKKAEETAKARMDSINSSTSVINRNNANRLTKTAY